MKIGLEYTIKHVVSKEDTAKVIGSGILDVLATPKMCALMEECAYKSIEPYLEKGTTSVGVLLNVNHISATPISLNVTIKSVITEIDGRKIKFKITAFDDNGEIGNGVHERVIVDVERFMAKVNSKL